MSEEPSTEDTQGESGVPPVPRRAPWRRILLGVAILVCGVAIGAGGGTILTKKATRQRIIQAWRNPGGMHGKMAKRIERELHLSPEQAKQVEDIVSRRMGAVREIMEERRPRVREQLDLMKEEVAEVLDESQAREWRERFGRLLRPPGPPGRGGHRPGGRERRMEGREGPGAVSPGRRGNGDEHERRPGRPPEPKQPQGSQDAPST